VNEMARRDHQSLKPGDSVCLAIRFRGKAARKTNLRGNNVQLADARPTAVAATVLRSEMRMPQFGAEHTKRPDDWRDPS